MPVTVIVGGQFGSEGKGKVSAAVAKVSRPAAIVRVGGPNSGHTAVDDSGKTWTLRQIPAAAVSCQATVIIPAGCLVDLPVLLAEARALGLTPERLRIHPNASLVSSVHRLREVRSGLVEQIGSTGSGTGASLVDRINRSGRHCLASSAPELAPYLDAELPVFMRDLLDGGARILVEGTQGIGLSLLHSPYYPYVTSRDTSAAGFVSEAGLSPLDVDDVVLVIRAFPIRVGGNSGPLPNEMSWTEVAREARLAENYCEYTSVTGRIRRVARFDAGIARLGVSINRPSRIAVNHIDYVDPDAAVSGPTHASLTFVHGVEAAIGQRIDLLGYGPDTLLPRAAIEQRMCA